MATRKKMKAIQKQFEINLKQIIINKMSENNLNELKVNICSLKTILLSRKYRKEFLVSSR